MCVNSFPSPTMPTLQLTKDNLQDEIDMNIDQDMDMDKTLPNSTSQLPKIRQQSVESIFKTLSQKIKELAIEHSIFNRYLHNMNKAYASAIGNITKIMKQVSSSNKLLINHMNQIESRVAIIENTLSKIESELYPRIQELEYNSTTLNFVVALLLIGVGLILIFIFIFVYFMLRYYDNR